jgi:3-hydroxybutyryl-CoA dehydrogenase
VGMHFFNPAPVMRLVEVVTTVLTGDHVAEAVTGLARGLGKEPVQVGDRAGFVANALLLPYLNHAVRLLETGYASRSDIDLAATAGIGLPMGPLALADLIGLDTVLAILEVLREEFGGTRYTPAPLLRRLTAAGRTGRKAGRGIYEHPVAADDKQTHDGNAAGFLPPDTVTLIGSGDDVEASLATALASAGVNVTRNPAHPSDLVLIAASGVQRVLPAALATGRPHDAAGLHLVRGLSEGSVAKGSVAEVVATACSSAHSVGAAAALAERIGLRVVHSPDRPGYLVGALLYPHLADAVRMVQEGYASPADVDTAMKAGCGYPRGPFELLDDVHPGTVLAGLQYMEQIYGDPSFAPPPLLTEHATLGFVGSPG